MTRKFRSMIHWTAGYTLIEILVVIAIVGILAAIAVPQFVAFRERSYCMTVKSDIGNLAIHQESYFFESETYIAATRLPDGTSNVPQHRWSPDVVVESSTGDKVNWSVVASHPNCRESPYTYDRAAGGFQ